MSTNAEVERMNARLEADYELAVVEAISGAVAQWMHSPEGKRQISAAVEPAKSKVRAKWSEVLELEEVYRRDS